MDDSKLKNNKTMQTEDMAIFRGNNVDNESKELKEKVKSLRARLLDLFTEKQKWQKQLQEVGENMSFDEVNNKMKRANDKIKKHQEIIVKCEECEKRHGKEVSIMVPIEEADSEYTSSKIIKDGDGEPRDVVCFYSVEHSQKRIAFWKEKIAKCEQKLQMMEIAQQQLTQVMMEIAYVNEQIKNVTTSLASEPLGKEPSNKINNVILENNTVRKDWIYTDKATSEDKERFEKHIEYLCGKKISAQQIKRYIKEQENDSILEHIDFTKQYEILEGIGVDFKKKTFLNA